MKADRLKGFQRIYQGLVGSLVCWFLFVTGYMIQYGEGMANQWDPFWQTITHFLFSTAEVGMALSIVTVLIGLTDASLLSGKLSKGRFWYYAKLLIYVVLAGSEIILMVQGPESLSETTPLQQYRTLLIALYIVEFTLLILVSLMAGRVTLGGFAETLNTYGAAAQAKESLRKTQTLLAVSCIGEIGTFIAAVLMTQSVYIKVLAGFIRTGILQGGSGLIYPAIAILFFVFLALRAVAEIRIVFSSRRVWKGLQELSE